jgi:hypothetical protein
VDKDDEFIKAVNEARQTVAEAKESIRGIFDEEEGVYPPDGEDQEVDPAPRPVPKGRKLVRSAVGDDELGDPAVPASSLAPSVPPEDEDAVEAEDWRAAPVVAREESAPPFDGGPKAGADDGAANGDQRGVPSDDAPAPKTSRRMIRPARGSGGDGTPPQE